MFSCCGGGVCTALCCMRIRASNTSKGTGCTQRRGITSFHANTGDMRSLQHQRPVLANRMQHITRAAHCWRERESK